MKLKHIFISFLLLGLISLIIYRIIANKEPQQQATGQPQQARVDGIIIQPRYFEDVLSLSGSLEADEQVEIRSEVSGIVQQINFKERSEERREGKSVGNGRARATRYRY